MSGTDHPPSTTSPMSLRRRALTAHRRPSAWPSAVLTGLVGRHQPRRRPREAASREPPPARGAGSSRPPWSASPPSPRPWRPPTTAPPPRPPPHRPRRRRPPPLPRPRRPCSRSPSGTGYNDPSNPAAWDRLAQCESGGNWAANTGNGYYGGIQFSLGSWQGVGGTGRPDQASRETQIAMGQRLWNQGGWQHWPACTLQARLPLGPSADRPSTGPARATRSVPAPVTALRQAPTGAGARPRPQSSSPSSSTSSPTTAKYSSSCTSTCVPSSRVTSTS